MVFVVVAATCAVSVAILACSAADLNAFVCCVLANMVVIVVILLAVAKGNARELEAIFDLCDCRG